mgnify:CR=1 FL=1|tara:strand:- start:1111 stop:1854 length:744 start_codon:yes stop_codon:yes gene_type:complete
MNKSKLRIVQDFVDFNKNKPEGIYLYVNKEDIFLNYAMIVGPKHTPYFGGYYLFEIKFPKNYPFKSPSVNFLTIDGKVRFNPNLYENGKVCLSILGTWSGPGWKSVMNIRSVLLSIQSLLHEFPIVNEPGYEECKPDSDRSINYNNYITYFNYKLAIINIIESIDSKKSGRNKHADKFKKEIFEELHKNFKELDDNLKSYQITIGIQELGKFMYFIRNKNTLDFLELNNKFNSLIKNISKKNEFNLI